MKALLLSLILTLCLVTPATAETIHLPWLAAPYTRLVIVDWSPDHVLPVHWEVWMGGHLRADGFRTQGSDSRVTSVVLPPGVTVTVFFYSAPGIECTEHDVTLTSDNGYVGGGCALSFTPGRV